MEHLCQITSLSRSISVSAVTPYFKGKLKGIYSTALSDAQAEAKLLQDALEKITEIKTYKAKAGLFVYLFLIRVTIFIAVIRILTTQFFRFLMMKQ